MSIFSYFGSFIPLCGRRRNTQFHGASNHQTPTENPYGFTTSLGSMVPPVDTTVSENPIVVERIGLAWRQLRRGTAINVLRDQLFGTGVDALDPGQMDTLDLLVKRDQWRMSDLAEALHVEPSTATRAIRRLVQSGLAERTASEQDRRVVLVCATDAGRARYDAVMKVRLKFFGDLIAQWTPAEADAIAVALEKLVAGIDIAVTNLQDEPTNG